MLGPEAPLIAIGSGLGVLAVQLAARDAPPTAADGDARDRQLRGDQLAARLAAGRRVPAARGVRARRPDARPRAACRACWRPGIGTLIFLGLDSITGLGTFTLTIPGLPAFDHLTVADFGYALAIGLIAPFLGRGITLLAIAVRSRVEPRMLLLMPVLGLLIGGLAIGFGEATDKSASEVLFSGQSALGALVGGAAAGRSVRCCCSSSARALAYSLSLSSFRGGPVFPSMFIGAAAGIAASHLPGLDAHPGGRRWASARCAR